MHWSIYQAGQLQSLNLLIATPAFVASSSCPATVNLLRRTLGYFFKFVKNYFKKSFNFIKNIWQDIFCGLVLNKLQFAYIYIFLLLQRLKQRFCLCQSAGCYYADLGDQTTFCGGHKIITLNLSRFN